MYDPRAFKSMRSARAISPSTWKSNSSLPDDGGRQTGAIVFTTDLDGTLLDRAQKISVHDWQTLEALGEDGIMRVIATGRSLYSARRVLGPDAPIDYVVFSSGAGAVHWPTGEVVFGHAMDPQTVANATAELRGQGCDFMLQSLVPDTHKFAYSRNGHEPNPDFDRRIEIYSEHARPMAAGDEVGSASQFVIVCSEARGLELVDHLRARLTDCHVVRTTSPLDGQSMWIEVFPSGVSKASGCAYLASQHNVARTDVMGIGNDFNDLDLLAWVGHAFVVANSPQEMRDQYEVVASHQESGVSESVRRWRARVGH
tara:strand:+ start:3463 stop:4401 length:939 start_codon:yes stop_codon:yes gene_type:complete